eukprot:TRINITY_DN24393_c0_g1_i3.p4 TRINITY_DN24393_c0_g1~~TRINITY_DN24393_c0_g1_i3.p4  ORF type:complete len:101 (+),score=32.19 TRINITY_DN24393_c0_g1_i3:459-761(+)
MPYPDSSPYQQGLGKQGIFSRALQMLAPMYSALIPVSYTHLRAHETSLHLVCRLLLEKKKKIKKKKIKKNKKRLNQKKKKIRNNIQKQIIRKKTKIYKQI